jgi:hypothetical protein
LVWIQVNCWKLRFFFDWNKNNINQVLYPVPYYGTKDLWYEM